MNAASQTIMYGLELAFVMFGALAASYIGSIYGRKAVLYGTVVTAIAGVAIQIAPHYAVMVVGRSIMGFAIGLASTGAIVFWTEIAPANARGTLVNLYQLSISITSFLGSCVNEGSNRLDSYWAFWIPLICSMVAPTCLLAVLWLLPESPRESHHLKLSVMRNY